MTGKNSQVEGLKYFLNTNFKAALWAIAPACGAALALLLLAAGVGRATGSGVIAFVSHRNNVNEIFLVDVATGQTRSLLSGAAFHDAFSPLWSPDGQRLAFTARFPNDDARVSSAFNSEVMVMNTGQGSPLNLTGHAADREYLADWSPDGQHILFLSNRNSAFGAYGEREFTNLFVMDVDCEGCSARQLGSFDLFNARPRWSPDGRRILFAAPGYLDSPDPLADMDWDTEIYVVNSDGSDLRQLTHNDEYDGLPAWSPDGAQIAFLSPLIGQTRVYLMNADGSQLRSLAGGRLSEYFNGETALVWSPDGRYLATVFYPDGAPDICRIEVATGEVRNLTRHPNADQSPVWSSDSRRLAFTSNRNGNLDIYVMDADGANMRNLTTHPAVDYSPAWWP
jgi:TolB protein